ncbi:hypothetical protein MTR_7g082720 [Medicago truncatula]|uniref:Uncharacterized protein n=1 Tax=Medicago truncatula TaxID=3880 RepID=G7KV81_MEDTR|nr:hypothetical protein MTR_7g082720 [Medicago truncatula]
MYLLAFYIDCTTDGVLNCGRSDLGMHSLIDVVDGLFTQLRILGLCLSIDE